jgi:hypothetical protein
MEITPRLVHEAAFICHILWLDCWNHWGHTLALSNEWHKWETRCAYYTNMLTFFNDLSAVIRGGE